MAHTIKGPKEGLNAWGLHWVGVLDGLFVVHLGSSGNAALTFK